MESIVEFLRTDLCLVILAGVCIFLFIAFIVNSIRISSLKKRYSDFMMKIGNGKNIADDLSDYINRVQRVEEKSEEITNYFKNLDRDMTGCIQKVGIVRYSAFRDTGSDLSFALALLDEKNNGVVLNGIYSREMSNIYAKPIENGTSINYTLSEEESEAVNKAMGPENICKVK